MIKSRVLVFIFYCLIVDSIFAQTFNLGRFSIGESRVQVKLEDFFIHHDSPLVTSRWNPSSVQWIRNENNLLVPRALLKIYINKNQALVHLNYQNKAIIPVKKKNYVETEIYVDLFNPETIFVFEGKTLLDKIVVEAHAPKDALSKQLIDYSCLPYNLKLMGLDNEYLSVGCKMNRLGTLGSETPRLEITFSSTNIRTVNDTKPPFTVYLEDNSLVEMKVKGINEDEKTIKLQALIPDRLYRLKTSFGFGPYIYESKQSSATQNANIAPSLMIYGKYDLNDTASFRAFDALLYSKTFFNNSGLYFSYDLASALDGRVFINALLGFQGLHYRYSKSDPTVFRLIYPQGFEVIYKHAFIENYNLIYGMFLSTNSESYTNAWLRYGKSNFLELNYIKWGHDKSEIKMWGLSFGIPLFGAF